MCTRKILVEFSVGSLPFTKLDLVNTTNHIQTRSGQFTCGEL